MISFSKNPNPTTEKKCYFFLFVFVSFFGGSTGSDFFTMNPNLIFFWVGDGLGGGGDGGGRWMDNRTGPNHFAPSTS